MNTPYTKVDSNAPEPEFQFTVITVCWNALADLKPTVESVLRQKAKGTISIEHVVVDGASTDGTPEWLAEQLAAGRIERYVSEPDRGIYDAMNKGINLARGQVLAFLNAGDTYTDENLAACVLPICSGETRMVAARTHISNAPPGKAMSPDYTQLYLRMPCHHPSFFAAAALYREMGGYDTKYKCCADLDIIHRMYRAAGSPLITRKIVADFLAGGVSANCEDDFRHENVDILWANWDMVTAKYTQDRDFKAMLEALLAHHCKQFMNWQQRHQRNIPETLKRLQAMCAAVSTCAHSLYARLALRFMAHCCLPPLIAGKPCPRITAMLLKFFIHACYVPDGNVYKDCVHLPNSPLSFRTLFFFLR